MTYQKGFVRVGYSAPEPGADESERAGELAQPLAAVVSTGACTVAAVLPSFLLGGLASLVRADLGFDEARLGLAVGCFYGASAAVSMAAGGIVGRLGASRALRVGLGLAVASLSGIAFLTPGWSHLAAFLALGGVANGFIQPATALALARRVPPQRLGVAFGIKQSAIPVATLLAGLAVPAIGLTLGWRWAFAIGAIGTLIVLATVPEISRHHMRSRAPRPRLVRQDLPQLARTAVAAGGGALAANSMGAFYVESAVSSGEALALAGILLSVGSVCGIAARLGSGWLADRFDLDPLRMVGVMLATGATGYATLGWGRGTVVLVAATVVAFTAGWGWAGLMQLAVVQDHMQAPAAASGIAHAGALIGGLVGPIAFGWIVSQRGYTSAWTTIAVVAFATGCAVLWGRRTRKPMSRHSEGAAGGF